MRSKLALVLLLAGLAAAGVAVSSRPSVAQPPPGPPVTAPALAKVLKYIHISPIGVEVSPNDNRWRENERSGEFKVTAVWEWYDENWNLIDEESENVTGDVRWTFDPNKYDAVRNQNWLADKLYVSQDYVHPDVYDVWIHVEARYMNEMGMATLIVTD